MKVEIAICTFNRSRQLRNTLRRLTQIDRSSCESCRVIVVDNNCIDDTPDVIDQFTDHLELVPLKESRQGHVHARNTAIAAAQGELLIWIDDDVIVGDDWLSAYVAAARSQTQASFWGGPIRPVFEQTKPKWIEENWDKLCGCFAQRDLGPQSFELTAERLPYGANFAVRTPIQKQFPFARQLGRSERIVLGEDDLALMRALLTAGHRGYWVPHATVDHLIDCTRTTIDYVGRYFRGQGQALVLKGQAWTNDAVQLKKERDHQMRCFAAKRFFSRSEVWLSHLLRGSLAAGQLEALQSDH